MTCDAGGARPSPAQVQLSVPCLTYRDAVCPPAIYRQLILQTLRSQDFFSLALPPFLSVFPVEMLRQCFPFSFKCEVSHLYMHCTH